jgi:hypothetical protein
MIMERESRCSQADSIDAPAESAATFCLPLQSHRLSSTWPMGKEYFLVKKIERKSAPPT